MSFHKQTVGQLAQRHDNAERFALRIQSPSQSSASCPGQALHQSTKLLILALRLPRGASPDARSQEYQSLEQSPGSCFSCNSQCWSWLSPSWRAARQQQAQARELGPQHGAAPSPGVGPRRRQRVWDTSKCWNRLPTPPRLSQRESCPWGGTLTGPR